MKPITPQASVKNSATYQALIAHFNTALQAGEKWISFAKLDPQPSALELSIAIDAFYDAGWLVGQTQKHVCQFDRLSTNNKKNQKNMSQPLTPLDAVKNNESYQDLIHSIGVKLQCGETEIDFDDDHDLDLATLGRDFSAVELSVALNEYRTQGWEVEKLKKNIYQFTAAPVATVTSVAPTHNAPVKPLSPQDILQQQSDDVYVDEIVAIINRLLKHTGDNRIALTAIRQASMVDDYHPADLEKAFQKFKQAGWYIKIRYHRNQFEFEVSELFRSWEEFMQYEFSFIFSPQHPQQIIVESTDLGAEETARELAR